MKTIVLFLVGLAICLNAGAQETGLKIGQKAPEIKLLTAGNEPFALSELKGKVVLIDFWATWCAPCIKEQPELKKFYDRLGKEVAGGKFEIVGVSLDKNRDSWLKTIDRFKITWPQVSDLKFWRSPVAKDYQIEELPYNVVIDGQGTIIAVNLHGKELETVILKQLQVQ